MVRLMVPRVVDIETKTYLQVPTSTGLAPNLDVELPALPGYIAATLSPETQDYLKTVLCALAEKFRSIQAAETEAAMLRKANEGLIQGRKDLEESLTDTTQQLREDGVKADKHLARVTEERNQIAVSLEKQTAINRDLETEIERLKKVVAGLQRDLTAQKLKDVESQNLLDEITSLKGRLQDSETRRGALQQQFGKTCESTRAEAKRHADAQTQWLSDKDTLLGTIRAREKTIEEMAAAAEGLQTEIGHLKEEKKLQGDLETQVGELRMEIEERHRREVDLRKQLKDLGSDLNAHKSDLEKRTVLYLQDKQRLSDQLSQFTKALESKTHEHLDCRRLLLDSQNSITTLEQLCCNKEDLHQLHEEAMAQVRSYQETKDSLTRELLFLSEYLLAQSQLRLELSNTAKTMAERISAKEDEIDQLKEVIAKLKKRMAVYVPVKVGGMQDDPVDCALADYLNNREMPLLIPFKREQPEIYNFGSKRIFVRLENGRITSKSSHSSRGRRLHDHRRVHRSLHPHRNGQSRQSDEQDCVPRRPASNGQVSLRRRFLRLGRKQSKEEDGDRGEVWIHGAARTEEVEQQSDEVWGEFLS